YISEQIDLPPALLSRFDIIFSMIDRPQADRDRELADHILKGHRVGEIRKRREAGLVTEETQALEEPYTPHLNPDFLRKYVAYAKRIYPIMTTEAMSVIEKKYLDIRKTGEAAGSSVPITPRQLEAIIRLAEAGARTRLSQAVTVDDADRPLRIVEHWTGKVAGDEGRFDIDITQTGISQSQRAQSIPSRDHHNELAGPATSSAKRPSRPRCARGSSLTAASCGSTACRTRSSCSCDPRLRRPVRGSSGLAPATQDPLGVLLEHQRVLSHEGVADDPQEDAEARETGGDGEERDQRIAKRPSGREDRPREATDEAEQAHAQPESQEEPTPSDSAPGEMESAEEDEDAAEVRREAQQGE